MTYLLMVGAVVAIFLFILLGGDGRESGRGEGGYDNGRRGGGCGCEE